MSIVEKLRGLWGSERKEKSENSYEIQGGSLASSEHPDSNEDAYFFNQDKGYAGVIDGIGGQLGGEQASKLAKQIIEQSVSSISDEASSEEVAKNLEFALRQSNVGLFHHLRPQLIGEGKLRDGENPPGAAAVLAKICKDGKLAVAHIGDCRAYIFRNGKLIPLTLDHNVKIRSANFNIKNPKSKDPAVRKQQFEYQNKIAESEDADELADTNRLYSALGQEEDENSLEIDATVIELQHGDIVGLFSDGATDNSKQSEMQSNFQKNKDLTALEKAILQDAYTTSEGETNRAKPDDITGVFMKYNGRKRSFVSGERKVDGARSESKNKAIETFGLDNFAPGQKVKFGPNLEYGPYEVEGPDEQKPDNILLKTSQGLYSVAKAEIVAGKQLLANKIEQSDNLDSFIKVVNDFGGIQGTKYFYPADLLERNLHAYIMQELGSSAQSAQRIELTVFPEALGYRKKLSELVQLAKARNALK